MAKYTTLLKTLVESGYKIDLQSYPIFSENHREELNKKIIEHFYFREIGFETAELFNFHLKRTMNEIMPYYNKLFRSELLENGVDFLTDFHESETIAKDTTDMSAAFSGATDKVFNKSASAAAEKTVTDGKSFDYTINSDTPQQNLVLDADSLQYASETQTNRGTGDSATPTKRHAGQTTETANNANNASTSDREQSEDITREKSGKSPGKTYAEMIEEYRNILLNIDMMIISELETLFMLIY